MRTLLFFVSFFFLHACGYDSDDSSYDNGSKGGGEAELVEAEFLKIKPTIEKSCGGGNCHNSGTARDAIISSGSKLIASRSNVLVSANKMPKPGSPQAEKFEASDKQAILGFITKFKK